MESEAEVITAESACVVPGCGRVVLAKGMCAMHYQRQRRNGSATTLRNAKAGAGTTRPDGYRAHRRNGIETLEHRAIAERALGKPLPPGAEVHHVDLARAHNAGPNLVICPNRAYHQLLHQRQRAMDACGNPNFRKCVYCKTYDAPERLAFYTNAKGSTNQHHPQCKRNAAKAAYDARKASK